MNINRTFLKQAGIFLLFVIGFWAISAMYLNPALGGEKVLTQGDMQQTRMMQDEALKYKESHGNYPGWTDGLFGGMPTSLITGVPSGNFVYFSGIVELFHLVSTPFNFLFVAMLAMFILLLSAGVNYWLSAGGAVGYAFMTFSITSYEAGHITKVLAMDVMPGVLAGLVLLSRSKYLLGSAVLGIFFTMLVAYFHYQIAYYMGIIAVVFLAVEVATAFQKGERRHALMVFGLGTAMLLVGSICNIGKMIDTKEYAKATMRGGSELAGKTLATGKGKQVGRTGLDRDYAFSWSYGIQESFTLLIPRYMGGSSNEDIGENELTNDNSRLPLYWGGLQFTSGPVYLGAVFIFLFILAIFIVLMLKRSGLDPHGLGIAFMWFSIITTAISLFLAWGRHFSILNNALFDYLPYYNKFRTPMMALAIAQVTVPFFGLYGLQKLLTTPIESKELKQLLKTIAIAVGSLLVVAAISLMLAEFKGASEIAMKKQGYPEETLRKLRDIRSSQSWADFFRTFIIIGLAFGMVYLTSFQKLSKNLFYIGMFLLIGFDMVSISNRYLSEENWQEKEIEQAISPSPVDEQLLAANKDYSRVFDLRYDPFNDNHSAPFHRNIGGYHPAKLNRYQDLIGYCITPEGQQMSMETIMKNNALDMLNCKYILSRNEQTKKEEVFARATALGNAWFVEKVLLVPDAKTAISTINTFNPKNEAIVESKESKKPQSNTYVKDSAASVVIKKYSLDTITYESNNAAAGLAVFSEVYYNENNGSWEATIDGKPAPLLRVNYMLRALDIPAGKHTIVMHFAFKFNPYQTVEKIASGLLLLLLAFALYKNATTNEVSEEKNA